LPDKGHKSGLPFVNAKRPMNNTGMAKTSLYFAHHFDLAFVIMLILNLMSDLKAIPISK
jgi:hypothetical protein